MQEKLPVVYIMASGPRGRLYTGITTDLPGRVWQHKNDLVAGYTRTHRAHTLVYFEVHGDMLAAITREKRLKKWRRAWKFALIEKKNPDWRDLYGEIV